MTGSAKFCKRSEHYFVVGFHDVEMQVDINVWVL